MATFNDTYDLFPSVEYGRVFLTNLSLFLEDLSMTLVVYEFYLCFLAVALTTFHLTILTRKSMRTSSIMSIMISIAICDLISIIDAFGYPKIVLNFELQDCSAPLTLVEMHVFSVMQAIRDNAIRCSTWLSVTMALIRYLVLKLAVKGGTLKLSRFSFGFEAFGVAVLFSTCLSVIFYLRVKIELAGEWGPADFCPDAFPIGPYYETLPSDLFLAFDGLVLRVVMCTHGIVTKIIPCLLFPILTGLLIYELQKAQKKRRSSDKKSTERTTVLVIFMTVSFFIALLPSGLITSLIVIYTDVGLLYMSTFADVICGSLLTLNSCFHCFICFAMSTQYRKTVKVVLRIPENIKPRAGSSNGGTTMHQNFMVTSSE